MKIIEIKLDIDEDVFADLKSHIAISVMMGQAGGILNNFVKKIMAETEKGNFHISISRKKKQSY